MTTTNATQTHAFLKTLPANTLTVFAVTCLVEIDEENRPIFELNVLDEAAWARFEAAGRPLENKFRCGCCGQRLKYEAFVEHRPTGTFYAVGRTCARTITAISSATHDRLDGVSVALFQRAECERRERQFRAARPEAVAALEWARTGVNRTAADIASKLRSYGLSDKQTAFLISLYDQDKARRAAATGTAPTGRQTITGKVVSVKVVVTPGYTRWGGDTTVLKVLVDLGNGAKVYGNAPGSVDQSELSAGDTVTFTGTFEPGRDPLFGFWKRPTKWVRVAAPATV